MIIIVLAILFEVVRAGTNTIYPILGSDCILDIDFIPATTSFTLNACYYVSQKRLKVTANWEKCTNKCCSPRKNYQLVQSSLDVCASDQSEYQKWLTGVILGSIFGPIFGIPLIFLVIKYACKNCSCPRRQQNVNHMEPSLDVIVFSEQELKENIKWSRSFEVKTEVCAICLESFANVQLSICRHMLHESCWKDWYKAHKSCVICRNQDTQNIKIYCRKCLEMYFEFKSYNLQHLKDIKNFSCQRCASRQ